MNHPRLTYLLLICVIFLGLVLSPAYAKQEAKKVVSRWTLFVTEAPIGFH